MPKRKRSQKFTHVKRHRTQNTGQARHSTDGTPNQAATESQNNELTGT